MPIQYGLTPQGFVPKTFEVIVAEIESSLRTTFGPGINLQQTQLLGQWVGIFAERETLIWEGMKDVYDSFNPENANGVSLDNVVSITAIKRLKATKTTGTIEKGNAAIAYGTLGTVILKDSVVSVAGNPAARFLVLADATIGAGTDAVQDIDFSTVPDAGAFTLIYNGEETADILFSDNAAAVQSALNNLPSLSGVSVAGDFTAGFTVTYSGADGQQAQVLLLVGSNTLFTGATPVTINIANTTTGVLPNVQIELAAETAGEIPAYANTVTVIETPISGWASVNNPFDLTVGKNIETDAELRLRRLKTLATSGAATVNAIRARILEIDEVEAARVFENDQDVPDLFGRPPHSFEAVVVNGDDQDIWDTIWEVKAAGIQTYGSEVGSVTDTQGYTHTVKFSRPTQKPVYIATTLTTDPALFPTGGDVSVQEALVDYGEDNFSIGDDVIYTMLFCPIHSVRGILDIDLDISFTTPPPPGSTSNLPIAENEISQWDTTFIDVTVV